jgi:hypothetical protein
MKKTDKPIDGTSFFHCTIHTTLSILRKVLGEPDYVDNSGDDKVNFRWEMETNDGKVFTVYDYKEYRPFKENEIIEWHIGAFNEIISNRAQMEIAHAIKNLK